MVVYHTIVTGSDGVGRLNLGEIMVNREDLSGHAFYLDERILEIGEKSVLTIPADVMGEIAYLRKDGCYALPIGIRFRHVNGELVAGANIYRGPNLGVYLEEMEDGRTLPPQAVTKDPASLETLIPADIPEWTQSGDD